jgi:alkanesulfonate monooxygenase SsuD/methylene tetrahydromethanopterin reductase-like flavin-dependent oxidoreductase (luciferase family)
MRFAVRIHQPGWTYPELASVWREIDLLGYDGGSLIDVLGAPGLECWTALTALAATSDNLTAIPLVLSNPYRHPALVAKMAATLDAVSGGRLILGLGAGGAPADAAAFGLQWPSSVPDRVAALEEAVDVIRLVWGGGGSYAGRWYCLDKAPGHPCPVKQGGPPILIGGHGDRYLLRAVARKADMANVGFDLGPTEWREYRTRLEALALEAGRDPGTLVLSHNATVMIGQDRAHLEHQVGMWARSRGVSFDAASGRLQRALVGAPEEIIARLKEMERVGITWVFLMFPDLPALTGVRLFAEAILPAFPHAEGTGATAGADK